MPFHFFEFADALTAVRHQPFPKTTKHEKLAGKNLMPGNSRCWGCRPFRKLFSVQTQIFCVIVHYVFMSYYFEGKCGKDGEGEGRGDRKKAFEKYCFFCFFGQSFVNRQLMGNYGRF